MTTFSSSNITFLRDRFSFFHLHLKILCRPSSCCSSCCQALINKVLYHQYYSKQGYRKHFLILLLWSHHLSLHPLPLFSLHCMSWKQRQIFFKLFSHWPIHSFFETMMVSVPSFTLSLCSYQRFDQPSVSLCGRQHMRKTHWLDLHRGRSWFSDMSLKHSFCHMITLSFLKNNLVDGKEDFLW